MLLFLPTHSLHVLYWPIVDRPTQLIYIWIFIDKYKRHSRAICYTDLRNDGSNALLVDSLAHSLVFQMVRCVPSEKTTFSWRKKGIFLKQIACIKENFELFLWCVASEKTYWYEKIFSWRKFWANFEFFLMRVEFEKSDWRRIKELFLKQHKPEKDTFCLFNFLQVSSGNAPGAPFSETYFDQDIIACIIWHRSRCTF